MTDISRLLGEAASLQRNGQIQEAAARYQQILAQNPQHPEALHLAAALARQTGNLSQALAYLEQAIAINPTDPRIFFLCGLTLEDLRRPDEAITRLRQAIDIKPDYAEAYNNIGIILHDQHRLEEAVASFRDAIRHNPLYARACNNLGNSLRELGDLDGARQQFEQATRLKPDYVLAWNHLGEIQRQLGRLDDAQASFTRAAQMKQGKNGAELNSLARVLREKNLTEQAVSAYRQAQTLAQHELKSALGSLLSLAVVYRNQDELLAARQRYADGLQVLHANTQNFIAHNRPQALLEDLRWSNFYLAYQGLDDKPLQVGYARFVAAILEKIAPQFMQPRAKIDTGGRRLRIGYLSSFFRDCTVGRYFKNWIMQLDHNRFEIFVYHTRPETDQTTHEIAGGCDHFRHLAAASPSGIATAVLSDNLDILVYPELGMDTTTFLLAAMRLAPVQCAGWGHPVTSGHANIDYYLSSAAMEPDNATSHYSEELVLLDGLGTHYSKPALPTPGRRADFSLPEGKTLYLCPQSLFKIHPDNDGLLAHIIERDPNGVLVLFSGDHPNITNTLLARLTQALRARGLDPQGRGIILPTIPHEDYLRVNMLCDVMLDTLHWSGGNTTLDAIACGLPVVTFPGEFMRGRQSYGMLKLMGLDELIAKNRDDYVEIALRLGTDKAWRQQVVQHIADNSGTIFNMQTPLHQLEQFYCSKFNT